MFYGRLRRARFVHSERIPTPDGIWRFLAERDYFWRARSKYPTVMVVAFECKLPNKWSGAVSLQRQTADNFVSKRACLSDQ